MSRDLDRQVAEALGWTNFHTDSAGVLWATDTKRATQRVNFTDIAAAIGALEEFCKAHRYSWKVERARLSMNHEPVICLILDSDAMVLSCCSDYDTIPAAICAAILSATKSAEEKR